MRVSVIGAGYVGLVTGAGLAEIGHHVVCVDRDTAKVDALNRGESHVFEKGLSDLVKRHTGDRLVASANTAEAVARSELTLITVDTPFDGQRIGLDSIKAVSRSIGAALADKNDYHVVAVKSTVVPGTTDTVVLPLLEEASGKQAGADFGVGMNPEFLREGSAVDDFLTPDRIVLGGIDAKTIELMAKLYAPFAGVPLLETSTTAAEMIKYAANAFLATLISFSNEIANLSSAVGVDSNDVFGGLHLDRRLMPVLDDGSRLRPGIISYVEPGCGFGGSCFPKDVRSLIAFSREQESPLKIMEAVIDVNERQPGRMVDMLRRHIPELEGVAVAVLGAAFKPGTDDIRESPGIEVARQLAEAGAQVTLVDPIANERAREVLNDRVSYAIDLAGIPKTVQGILLITAWDEFSELPGLVAALDPSPVVVDGRRFYSRSDFGRYEAIGL